MNLHQIRTASKDLFWALQREDGRLHGDGTQCPDARRAYAHHMCAERFFSTVGDARHAVIYCECGRCYTDHNVHQSAHYFVQDIEQRDINGEFLCAACHEGNHPTPPL